MLYNCFTTHGAINVTEIFILTPSSLMIRCGMQRVILPSVVMWRKYLRKNITIGLEVNADKTQYMVISRDRIAGRSHSIKIGKININKKIQLDATVRRHLFTAVTLHVSGVTAPIIRSTKNCNRYPWYRS
jgi:hypothetical protein